jgi:abhydrolase domain-containing protein 12
MHANPNFFRFAGNQVTPFYIETPDGEKLFAWHILPRALYAKHEKELLNERLERENAFETTLAYRLLVEDPESRLIINCEFLSASILELKLY